MQSQIIKKYQLTEMRPIILRVYLLLIVCILAALGNLNAQSRMIVNETFAGPTSFYDLSLLTLWGNHSQPTSAFKTAIVDDGLGNNFNCITLTDSAMRNSGFTTASSLKTCTAIDWKFPYAINRELDTVVAEFDTYWYSLVTNG
jgi:hypothetical protein